MINLKLVAEFILQQNNIEILCHRYPDGDTLGCGFGLCLGLQSLGKNACVTVPGGVPKKFAYLTEGVKEQHFTPSYIISVDVAAPELLGDLRETYENKIDLCIDHHGSNSIISKQSYVDSSAAAASEIIYMLLLCMKVKISKEIANCIYTGISTDTGCFRYSNTSNTTHQIACHLMTAGCDWFKINQEMFEIKTRQKVMLERMVYDTMEFFAQGKCAIIYTTLQMQESLNIPDDEMEGLASIPRQIEGVLIGITMREKADGTFKISVRTNGDVDASEFCKNFGGGGHMAAAGCSITGSLQEVKQQLINKAVEIL